MNELRHHGIKGMHWGVRNGPPYPIDHRGMDKGTRLSSVSPYTNSKRYQESGRAMYTYNPKDKWDSAVYKGPFARYKIEMTNAMLYEHKFETVKDLKMPTKKERVDAFLEIYSKEKSSTVKDLKAVQKMLVQQRVGNEEQQKAYKKVNLKKLKTEKDQQVAYEIFNHAMENYARFKSTKKYMDLMSTRYDAMVDDNNQGIYNEAHDPVIIFNPKESLKIIEEAREIPIPEIIDNMNYVRERRGGRLMF